MFFEHYQAREREHRNKLRRLNNESRVLSAFIPGKRRNELFDFVGVAASARIFPRNTSTPLKSPRSNLLERKATFLWGRVHRGFSRSVLLELFSDLSIDLLIQKD